jgi:hypothetical protein
MKATALLKRDHAAVKTLFTRFGRLRRDDAERRRALVDRIVTELEIHATVEEEMFYPLLEPLAEKLVEEGEHEHAEIKSLVAEAQGAAPASAALDRVMAKLRNQVLHHVAEEEGEMFAAAEQLGREHLSRLGEEMAARKEQLATSPLQKAMRGVKKAIRKVA